MCGEYEDGIETLKDTFTDHPPLARKILTGTVELGGTDRNRPLRIAYRTTPAGAGNTGLNAIFAAWTGDHPRRRGEYLADV